MSLDDVIGKKAKKPVGRTGGASKKFARQQGKNAGAKAAPRKNKAGGEAKGTEDKLEMTLEDLVQREAHTGAKGGGKKLGGFGKRTLAKQKQNQKEGGKAKGKGNGNTKADRKGRGKGKAKDYDDWAPARKGNNKGRGKSKRWEEVDAWKGGGKGDWGRKGGKGNGKYGGRDFYDEWEEPRRGSRKGKGKRDWYEDDEDWGKGSRKGKGKRRDYDYEDDDYYMPKGSRKGAGKRRDHDEDDFDRRAPPRRRAMSDDWEPPAPKRARHIDDRDDDRRVRPAGGKGGGRDQFWGAGDLGPARSRRPEEGSRREVSRHIGAQREAPSRGGGGHTSIRVTNVPKNLDERDIKEAFSDLGRVLSCQVAGGKAHIVFQNEKDARKAVQTFDRGEMNGQTISVSIE